MEEWMWLKIFLKTTTKKVEPIPFNGAPASFLLGGTDFFSNV